MARQSSIFDRFADQMSASLTEDMSTTSEIPDVPMQEDPRDHSTTHQSASPPRVQFLLEERDVVVPGSNVQDPPSARSPIRLRPELKDHDIVAPNTNVQDLPSAHSPVRLQAKVKKRDVVTQERNVQSSSSVRPPIRVQCKVEDHDVAMQNVKVLDEDDDNNEDDNDNEDEDDNDNEDEDDDSASIVTRPNVNNTRSELRYGAHPEYNFEFVNNLPWAIYSNIPKTVCTGILFHDQIHFVELIYAFERHTWIAWM